MAKKNQAAASLGKLGGRARAKKLTQEQRTESARKAAVARWVREKDRPQDGKNTTLK
jgi:hypothetical protein